jgi:hypothetical protein
MAQRPAGRVRQVRILAIDTALGACSACVAEAGAEGRRQILADETIVMARGHAEALLPLVDRVVSRVEGGFKSLRRVAVTVGPGSFTGLGSGSRRRARSGSRRGFRRRGHHPVGAARLRGDRGRPAAGRRRDRRPQRPGLFSGDRPGGRTVIAPGS